MKFLVSNHFGQNGSYPKLSLRTGVAVGFWPETPLRGPQKVLFLPKTGGIFDFFLKFFLKFDRGTIVAENVLKMGPP